MGLTRGGGAVIMAEEPRPHTPRGGWPRTQQVSGWCTCVYSDRAGVIQQLFLAGANSLNRCVEVDEHP
jgi:hypothetical protein